MPEVNAGVALLLTVRSAPTQTLIDLLSLPVVLVVLVVKVAVLLWSVQVPATSVNVCEYVNVLGVSVASTVPSEPPKVSVTVMLPSVTLMDAALKSTAAVPVAVLLSSHAAFAVLVPASGELP